MTARKSNRRETKSPMIYIDLHLIALLDRVYSIVLLDRVTRRGLRPACGRGFGPPAAGASARLRPGPPRSNFVARLDQRAASGRGAPWPGPRIDATAES